MPSASQVSLHIARDASRPQQPKQARRCLATWRKPQSCQRPCAQCLANARGARVFASPRRMRWAEAHEKIARMTLTIKLDRNWSSFQLANSAPPLSVTDSAIAPSARMDQFALRVLSCIWQVAPRCLEARARADMTPAKGEATTRPIKAQGRLQRLPKGCAAPDVVPCQCNTRECLSKLEAKTLPAEKFM